jgi:hypothetical protein
VRSLIADSGHPASLASIDETGEGEAKTKHGRT